MVELVVFLLYLTGYRGILELEMITNEEGMLNLPKDKSKEGDQESILMKNRLHEQELKNRFNL